jgi:hypothetical protein
MIGRITLLALAYITLAGCEKEELPVPPFDRGAAITAQVEMGPGYRDQIWFSMDQNSIMAKQPLTAWDIALDNRTNKYGIYLNDARLMFSWKSPHLDLAQAQDTTGFGIEKKLELPQLFHTAPAIGQIETEDNSVYLLDMGFNHLGLHMGLYWLQIVEASHTTYHVAYKRFNSTDIHSLHVPRENQKTLVHISLIQQTILSTPPPALQWDLLFTRYTFRFEAQNINYLVTGVILNPHKTRAVEVQGKSWDEISASDTLSYPLTNKPDAIGYDWKTYNFSTARFDIHPERIYIIYSQQGFLYKLRFLDFYSPTGTAGAPLFEFAKV